MRRTRSSRRWPATSPRNAWTGSTRCPSDIGERIRDLREYDFMEPEPRRRFDELVDRLRQQMLEQFVGQMREAIGSMTDEDLAANREMVRDLNALIRERIAGREPDVSEFLARHGRFFPGARTFDDIIEQLAERMAALQSLMRSLSPEQRAELESMMDALLRDDRLAGRPRRARLEPRPPDPGRARRPVPVLRRRVPVARRRARPDRSAPGDGAAGGRARRRRRARATSMPSTATRSATCSATTRRANSMRSTTWPDGSRRPAT